MAKLYFADSINELRCYTLSDIKDMARFRGIEEIEVVEAKRDVGEGHFYCKFYDEVGEVGEGCGKECKGYSPRNGKSGRCRHSAHCYSRTENKRTIKMKPSSTNQ